MMVGGGSWMWDYLETYLQKVFKQTLVQKELRQWRLKIDACLNLKNMISKVINIFIIFIFTEHLNILSWSCVQIMYSIKKYKLFRHNFVSNDNRSAHPPLLPVKRYGDIMCTFMFYTAGLCLKGSGTRALSRCSSNPSNPTSYLPGCVASVKKGAKGGRWIGGGATGLETVSVQHHHRPTMSFCLRFCWINTFSLRKIH